MKAVTTVGPFLQFNTKGEENLCFYAHGMDARKYPYGWMWIATYGIEWDKKYRILREVNENKS